jgi:DNA repair exonuclease SbcCD nuclease subunit
MILPSPLVKFISDLHFSHKPPLCRAETNWYEVQEKYWWQVVNLVEKDLPIVIAGDIFDKAIPPLELVRFVINLFQSTNAKIYTIAGNHDLPQHNLGEMHRSAYGILRECQAIEDIGPGESRSIIDISRNNPTVNLCGFPCGCELKPLDKWLDGLKVAVVHDYIWNENLPETGYVGAPESKTVLNKSLRDMFPAYDVLVFGDNHTPFHTNPIYNCGTLIRRKRDEIKHQPGIGVLYTDKFIKRYRLDTSQDKFTDAREVIEVMDNIGVNSFVEELLALGDIALDFSATIRRLLDKDKVEEDVKEFILRCLERAGDKK